MGRAKEAAPVALGPGDEADEEVYRAYLQQTRQVMEAAGWPWPEQVVLDPQKRPRFVTSVEDFLYELRYGEHMDQVVVFPEGLRLLDHHCAINDDVHAALYPAELEDPDVPVECARSADTAFDVLSSLWRKGALDRLKGKITYQRGDRGGAAGRGIEAAAGGKGNSCLQPKFEDLESSIADGSKHTVYMAEVRNMQSCESDKKGGLRKRRKSTLKSTMRERLYEMVGFDARTMLYWDDFSEGFFVGGDTAGYRLHVDCIQSSNVGSLFAGHKLLALWQYPEVTKRIMDKHFDTLFVPPLGAAQHEALDQACCVALAPPGSVYIFSGANAHVVCNVGWAAPAQPDVKPHRSLCVASYEAFTNLHPTHVAALADTNGDCHADQCHLDDEDLDDFDDDVLDQLRNIVDHLADQEGPRGTDEVAMVLALQTACNTSPRYYRALQDVCGRQLLRQALSTDASGEEEAARAAAAAPIERRGDKDSDVDETGCQQSPSTAASSGDEPPWPKRRRVPSKEAAGDDGGEGEVEVERQQTGEKNEFDVSKMD